MIQVQESTTYNLEKRINQYVVIDLIRKKGPITIPQIVRISELSRPTVDDVVDTLRKKKVVKRVGFAPSRGGRKPTLWKLNNKAGYVVGVDMVSPYVTTILTDLEANIVSESIGYFPLDAGKEKIISYLKEEIHKTINKAGIINQNIIGIGIGVPGLIDKSAGISTSIERIPGWNNVSIVDILKKEFNVPIFLENDVNLMAIAERWLGDEQGTENMIYVAFRTGVGAGIFINGELFSGVYGNAGFLGHTTVDKDGPLCVCGNRGCLELFADEPAIVNKARKGLKNGVKTRISALVDGKMERVNAEIIFMAASEGDLFALDIVREVGQYLGIGIANIVNLFDTQLIVIGGCITKAGESFLRSIRKTVEKRLSPQFNKNLKIKYAKVDSTAAALGATILALQDLFKVPSINLSA